MSAELTTLRALRDAATDAAQRAALDAAIAALEAASPPPNRTHTQHIHEYTSIQAAVAGDVHGDIYIVGERAQSTRVLLAGYLRWLASKCGQLPLCGVREQKAATDVLNISLDQIYTQLATDILVIREMFAGDALEQFDAQAYLREHVADLLLPGQQRWIMAATPAHRERRPDQLIGMSQSRDGFDLRTLPIDQLVHIIQSATEITFYGPRLVTEAIAAAPARIARVFERGAAEGWKRRRVGRFPRLPPSVLPRSNALGVARFYPRAR